MVTIRRHPVPLDSYNPDRPLNDLLKNQFRHFVHVEERLPPELRVNMPVPSSDDVPAVNRFIAAVTTQLMNIKRSPPLRLVPRSARKSLTPAISLAAQAEPATPPRTAKKKTASARRTKSSSAKSKSTPEKSRPKATSKPKPKATRRGK